ncbi:MAG: hypothetical protein AAGG51_03310 [Cyanobacteria bacterium P01_G01_bin.54]
MSDWMESVSESELEKAAQRAYSDWQKAYEVRTRLRQDKSFADSLSQFERIDIAQTEKALYRHHQNILAMLKQRGYG